MTFFDLFVLAILGASIVAGAMRGFVRALIATFGLIVGLFIAAQTYEQAGAFLLKAGLVKSVAGAHAGGFLLVTGLVLVAGFILGEFVRAGLRQARLEWFDRALGACFGFVRGMAVCSVIYLALTAFPVRIESVEQARTAPALAEGAQILALCTSSDVRARFVSEYKRLLSLKFTHRSGNLFGFATF
jgi:membrane protein required for colicin V production